MKRTPHDLPERMASCIMSVQGMFADSAYTQSTWADLLKAAGCAYYAHVASAMRSEGILMPVNAKKKELQMNPRIPVTPEFCEQVIIDAGHVPENPELPNIEKIIAQKKREREALYNAVNRLAETHAQRTVHDMYTEYRRLKTAIAECDMRITLLNQDINRIKGHKQFSGIAEHHVPHTMQ